MPVLAVIGHLTLVNSYMLGTGITIFSIQGLKAVAAVGSSLLHDVALAPQHRLTLKAAEVSHVPMPSFSLCALICKDDLITGCTARLQALSMVPATVDLPILVKVDQVNQKLIADGAYKAWWMPADAMAST